MAARAVLSWALYDFANTIFYGVVVTFYLPGYVEDLTGGKTTPYALAFYPAMILSALLSPALGDLADRTGRAKRYTVIATVLCCLLSASLALPRSGGAVLALFALSLIAYQAAIGFYNVLLPSVASEKIMARVSGLGVGLGYVGNVFALLLATAVYHRSGDDPRPTFVLAGALMLLFSVPLMLFCKDKPVAASRVRFTTLLRSNLGASWRLAKRAVADRGLMWFFLGNLLCADVLNTVYGFLRLWVESPSGLALDPLWVIVALNVACLPAALLLGLLADRRGEKLVTLIGAAALLVAVLVPQILVEIEHSVAGESRALGHAAAVVVVVAGAVGVGGLLGAARKWLVRLVPANEIGGWFGVYGLTGKLSLLSIYPFALLRDLTGNYLWSVLLLAAVLACGMFCLMRAPQRGSA